MFPITTRTCLPIARRTFRKVTGTEALGGAKPFILHPDGVGWLYVATGLKDGPLPAHYEPLESAVDNPLYSQQTIPPRTGKSGLIIRMPLHTTLAFLTCLAPTV